MMFEIIRKDLDRYRNAKTGRFQWNEPSWIVVLLFRMGQWIRRIPFSPIRLVLNLFFVPTYAFWTVFTGIALPRGAQIGPGFRIFHFGAIAINPKCTIGRNLTIRQGVTIGSKNGSDDVPTIGDNCAIGAGAKVLGSIHVGNNVTIGANAVVISDVPDNCVAVGVPARCCARCEEER